MSATPANPALESTNRGFAPPLAGTPRRLRPIYSLDDFEAAAKRHLPRPVFAYVAMAAEDRRAEFANRAAFDEYAMTPRVLVDVSRRHQNVELFGQTWAMPFGIAPMGLSALSAYRGDIVQARAARAANIPMILSGTSLIRLEDVIAEAPGTWFQAYVPGDQARIDALLERVAAAGYRTLVVTVDVPFEQHARRLLDAAASFVAPRLRRPGSPALAVRHVRAHAAQARDAALRELVCGARRACPFAERVARFLCARQPDLETPRAHAQALDRRADREGHPASR